MPVGHITKIALRLGCKLRCDPVSDIFTLPKQGHPKGMYKDKPEGGPHTFTSPDGLHWTRLSHEPICRSNDVITVYYDEERQLYVAFPKHSTEVRGQVRRCFAMSTSKDFVTWTTPRYVFKPDLIDDAGSLARIEQVRSQLDVPDNPKLMRA